MKLTRLEMPSKPGLLGLGDRILTSAKTSPLPQQLLRIINITCTVHAIAFFVVTFA